VKENINLDAKVGVDVGEFQWTGQLKSLLWVDLDDLEKVMISQASWTAWFCVVLGKANTMLKRKDFELDKKYSELYLRYSQELASASSRITEATIKAHILINPEYTVLQDDYAKLSEQVSLLSGVVRGFEHRKDMVVQLSALKRRELLTGDFEDAPTKDVKDVRERYTK